MPWKDACCLVAVLSASLVPSVGLGRAFEVRLVKGTEENGVWGTDEFQVAVTPQGTVRHVAVRGRELIQQAAALYTAPIPPGGKEGVRTVQGEGFGERGLTVAPPERDCRAEGGKRIFAFRHAVANKLVLDGKPLCQVDQQIVITPTGEISVSYDCLWLHTLTWHGFNLLILFDKQAIAEREYLLLIDDGVLTGRLALGSPLGPARIRQPFSRLTVWSDAGPLHYVFDAPSTCELIPPQLTVQPRAIPYRAAISKDVIDRISFRILLPVSQQ
jgi:hypothetical protein